MNGSHCVRRYAFALGGSLEELPVVIVVILQVHCGGIRYTTRLGRICRRRRRSRGVRSRMRTFSVGVHEIVGAFAAKHRKLLHPDGSKRGLPGSQAGANVLRASAPSGTAQRLSLQVRCTPGDPGR